MHDRRFNARNALHAPAVDVVLRKKNTFEEGMLFAYIVTERVQVWFISNKTFKPTMQMGAIIQINH